MNLRLGSASVVITPEKPKGLALGGYGDRKKYCQGVHDDLYARIQYFRWGDHDKSQMILISLDLIGINSNVLDFFIRRISDRHNVPYDHIVIACTHTHSGFESLGVLGPGKLGFTGIFTSRLKTRVLFEMFKKIEGALTIAIKNLTPVIMGHQQLTLNSLIAINRRKPQRVAVPAINIVKFTTLDGGLVSVIINTPIHATILPGSNYLMSADWIGQFIIRLGNLLADGKVKFQNGTEIFINFFNGAQGNIIPFKPAYLDISAENSLRSAKLLTKKKFCADPASRPENDFAATKRYGYFLADKIGPRITDIECSPVKEIKFGQSRFLIPLFGVPRGNRLKDVLSHLKNSVSKSVLLLLLKLEHSVINPFLNLVRKNGNEYIQGRISAVKIEELLMITSPGEMFYEIGQDIRQRIAKNSLQREEKILILGLANDYMSYLFPLAAYYKGGYEPVFQFAPRAGILVRRELGKLGLELVKQ